MTECRHAYVELVPSHEIVSYCEQVKGPIPDTRAGEDLALACISHSHAGRQLLYTSMAQGISIRVIGFYACHVCYNADVVATTMISYSPTCEPRAPLKLTPDP